MIFVWGGDSLSPGSWLPSVNNFASSCVRSREKSSWGLNSDSYQDVFGCLLTLLSEVTRVSLLLLQEGLCHRGFGASVSQPLVLLNLQARVLDTEAHQYQTLEFGTERKAYYGFVQGWVAPALRTQRY